MANFDVSFLNPKLKKPSSTDYGFLIDQLDIKKNQLEADGYLSPGDYKILTEEARKIYAHPGLTDAQRSTVDVKISSYKSSSTTTALKESQNLSKTDRDIKDGNSKIQMVFANNPEAFVKSQGDLLKANIDEIQNNIDQIEASQGDASTQYDKRDALIQNYQDTLYALNDIQTKNPNPNYGAYAVTNSRGEIVDLKIGKIGTTNGYLPTNGTYGGLPLYGKSNRTNDAGKNVFTIGNQNFVEGQDLVSGPDGVSTMRKLVLEGTSKGGYSVNAGKVEITSPTSSLKAQSVIAPGGWGEGSNGFLYQRSTDGNTYTKYVGTDKTSLGIKDGEIMRLPSYYEQSVLKDATITQDNTPSIPTPLPPSGLTPSATTTSSTTTPTPTPTPPTGKGTQNTGGAPEVRSPSTAQGIAGNLIEKAKGFLGGLFGN